MLKRTVIAVCGLAFSAAGFAKLPDPTPEQKAAAALNAAKAAYGTKMEAYTTCQAQTRVAEVYIRDQKAAGKTYTAEATPACVNPGPFVPPEASAAPAAAPAQPAAATAAPAQSATAAKK